MNEVDAYHRGLVERLRALLGTDLVGVYAGGSYALGGYDPQRSDVDVAVVCRRPLSIEQKADVAAALRHEALPCPARDLELVVYTEATVRSGTGDPGYELNLNTGRAMPFVFSTCPEGESHWYGIDRAIVREHGIVLFGPPPAELFAPLPRGSLLRLVADSVRWHEEHESVRADDAVLNACRAWRFATDGEWSSKPDAGDWARGRLGEDAVVSAALAARTGGEPPARDRVDAFLRRIRRRLEDVLAGEDVSRS